MEPGHATALALTSAAVSLDRRLATREVDSMNIRHVAALALVGWYLMMPPINTRHAPDNLVDMYASLREWDILESIDQADDCEQVRQAMVYRAGATLESWRRSSKKDAHRNIWSAPLDYFSRLA